MDKAIVTCAVTGVLTNPDQHPVPVTPEEMAAAAKEAYDAGASVMHLHFRDQRRRRELVQLLLGLLAVRPVDARAEQLLRRHRLPVPRLLHGREPQPGADVSPGMEAPERL